MLKELIQKQQEKKLELFTRKTTDFGRHSKEITEKSADIISERMNNALKKNLSQQGFGKMGAEVPN